MRLPADSWGAAAEKMPLPALPDGWKLLWMGPYKGGLGFINSRASASK